MPRARGRSPLSSSSRPSGIRSVSRSLSSSARMASRRFSQAISEGDGISVVVEIHDLDSARAAAEQGAEALVIRAPVNGLRDACELPFLWRGGGSLNEAAQAGGRAPP